jgi:hypothetical protein
MSAAKFKTIAPNVCHEVGTDRFYHVVRLPGKKYPTKRKLNATAKRAAIAEVSFIKTRQREAQLGVGLDPYAEGITAGKIMDDWEKADCPDREGNARHGESLEAEKAKLRRLRPFWQNIVATEIASWRHSTEYGEQRKRKNKSPFSLGRSINAELNSLSNAFSWAVKTEVIKSNPLASNRKNFYDLGKVRHCTSVMPQSDEEFHQRIAVLLASDKTRPLGFQYALEGLTGGRTSEILRCRTDAKALPNDGGEPGYFDAFNLHVHRCKDGINPFTPMEAAPGHDPLRDFMQAFWHWHETEHPKSPWFIPGLRSGQPMTRCALNKALIRTSEILKLDKVTSHGQRAYFVHTLRSMGIPDNEIAARLGHRSTQQVEQTYGKVKTGWFGSWKQDFLPDDCAPAWATWTPPTPYQILIKPEPKDRDRSKQTGITHPHKSQ